MVYLPTFPLECGHFSPNVGKYTIHGSYGLGYTVTHKFLTAGSPEKISSPGILHGVRTPVVPQP